MKNKTILALLIGMASYSVAFGQETADKEEAKTEQQEEIVVENKDSDKSFLADVTQIRIDNNITIDAKKMIDQANAMITASGEKAKNVNKEEVYKTIINSKIIEQLFVASAKKISLQNDEQVKEQIKTMVEQILVRAYISKIMKERVTEEALKAEYEAYKAEFKTPKPAIEIGNILVKDEKTAREVIAKLEKGGKFPELAKEYSLAPNKNTGGREEILPISDLPPAISKLADLSEGQFLKEPMQTQVGYHVFYVYSKRTMEAQPREKVQRMLEQNVFKKELDKLVQTLMKTIPIVAYNKSGKEVEILKTLAEPPAPNEDEAQETSTAVTPAAKANGPEPIKEPESKKSEESAKDKEEEQTSFWQKLKGAFGGNK